MNTLRTFIRMQLPVILLCALSGASAQDVPLYGIHELTLTGPSYGPKDTPSVDVELVARWRHEDGRDTLQVHGFWDGDGRGGAKGNLFKVRFCPTKVGVWTLVDVRSNHAELAGQHEGMTVRCRQSEHPGFWIADDDASGRWYKRSNGSHPYIVGNTMYSFLSECDGKGPTGGNIVNDVAGNSEYFKKIRFSIMPCRYPNPNSKPFLDDAGEPTDDGNFSHRPNPQWFHDRVDLAVQTAYENDLIADLILNGPDTEDARSVLRAGRSGGDPTPLLRYIAARYGSYPNVWLCLANEFDIKKPSYTPQQIVQFGTTLRRFLPYPTPVSVHAKPRDWDRELHSDPAWHDHVIIQKKLKSLPLAADWVARNYAIGGRVPVIDDELAYEGKGDGWSEADVIESHLGAFLGGGYGTTGHKPASKQGHYFWGRFRAHEHEAADNLLWMRRVIDRNVTFWRMVPVDDTDREDRNIGIFANVDSDSRAMAWAGHEYVLGTNESRRDIEVTLPKGKWQVTQYDVILKAKTQLAMDAEGKLRFNAPDSRAVLFHLERLSE